MPASSNVVEFTIIFGSTERGSCGKTCRRACWLNLEAQPAQEESEVSLRTCSRDMFSHLLCGVRHSERSRGIPVNCLAILLRDPSTPLRSAQDDERSSSGEDRNRTYPGSGYAEPTTVLKTARTTRHPSLSSKKKTPNAERPTSNIQLPELGVERWALSVGR